ncbi:hypothetical protein [Rossellomorea sp. YZS02]|uniref:hypothetical protein n=1 Tax=Rossellomorea sp. YZS02 TaxID=3097358 RepID=UPI002A1055B0|nr:hypothetical protein [Rossellomorea sp. YZS02]MDX8344895.1 hypothetical protein [Rossellomorea sp. YZS02]
MREIALAFGNIFGGIALIAILASLWGRFETCFLHRLTLFRQHLFLFALTLFIEVLSLLFIYIFFHMAIQDALFISSVFFLFVTRVIPYHSRFNMNTEMLFLKKFGLSSPIQVFRPVLSPFFVGTLPYSTCGFIIAFGWRYFF